MSNPIQYTSRTYQTILNDINSVAELKDKPIWWKRIWAGIGDLMSVYLNAQANNSFLRTAFTRQAVIDLCELIDYQLTPRSTSSGLLIYNLDSGVTFPFTLSVADQAAQTSGSITASSFRFEGRTSITVATQPTETFTADAGTDLLTVATQYYTGQKCRVSTTTTLPDPLAAATDYWIIAVSATTIKLATSLANAIAGTAIDLTDAGTGTHTLELLSVVGTVYQQTTIDQYSAGTADSTAEWQEIDLIDANILRDTLAVTINSQAWNVLGTTGYESSFVFYGAADKVAKLLYNTDETSRLQFGNGTYGEIPGSFDVFVSYAVGGGSESNISENRITLYAGSDSDVETVINPEAMTGGAGAESVESAKVLAPLLLKARDRFVTTEDGEALVLAYGGLTTTRINSNAFGILSAQVLAIAAGGGNPSAGVKSALQQYLIDRTVLEGIDVRVEDATITSVNVTASVKALSGFLYADIEKYIELAFQLLFSETGNEIQDLYISDGIESATSLINVIFGTSFSAIDAGQLIELIDNLEPREFGDTIQESDVLAYVDGHVFGVDYLTITAPSFPISLADDEITTDGTISLTEIS
jgi:hypothetical protein